MQNLPGPPLNRSRTRPCHPVVSGPPPSRAASGPVPLPPLPAGQANPGRHLQGHGAWSGLGSEAIAGSGRPHCCGVSTALRSSVARDSTCRWGYGNSPKKNGEQTEKGKEKGTVGAGRKKLGGREIKHPCFWAASEGLSGQRAASTRYCVGEIHPLIHLDPGAFGYNSIQKHFQNDTTSAAPLPGMSSCGRV